MGFATVVLSGNVGKNPEFRDGKTSPMAKFSVGVSRKKTDETMWFNVAAWGKTAEYVMQHVQKGQRILVVGDLQSRSYQAKDGTTKYSFEVNAKDISPLTDKRTDEALADGSKNKFQPPSPVDEDLPF